jgi:hypothetical protein
VGVGKSAVSPSRTLKGAPSKVQVEASFCLLLVEVEETDPHEASKGQRNKRAKAKVRFFINSRIAFLYGKGKTRFYGWNGHFLPKHVGFFG